MVDDLIDDKKETDNDDDLSDDQIKDDSSEQDVQDMLELSDDDFAKLEEPDAETIKTAEDKALEDAEAAKKKAENDLKEKEDQDDDPDKQKSATDADLDDDDIKKEVDDKKANDTKKKQVDATDDNDDDDDKKQKKEDSKKKSDKTDLNYKAEYEKITAPFTANGVQMQIKNADDAIRLMQMGANYHKKMAGLKPSLKILKLLEKNKLLDPNDLNYLIDLKNKNPEAITKLLKDSDLDPLDIDIKSKSTYAPTQHTVSDAEVDLDSVLLDLKDSPTYEKTLTTITQDWDESSRNAIANEPNIIAVINGHMESGIFDKVTSAVTYERSMGRLGTMSDLEAYKITGDKLNAAGKLSSPDPADKSQKKTQSKKTDTATEEKRKARKKAASSTKKTGTVTAPKYDPLSMSDDDFEKIDLSKLKVK